MARCALVVVGVLLASTGARVPTSPDLRKLDPALRVEAAALPASVRVIVQTGDAPAVERTVRRVGGRVGRRLNGGRALVAEVASGRLRELTGSSAVRSVRLDRRIEGALERAGISTGARWVQENLGIDGAGIGIAIIDSGVTSAHDDLGPDRVVHFANFVDLQPEPHDGYGHGTHVAGILAGSGFDSGGARRGIAPGAHLVVLKALDLPAALARVALSAAMQDFIDEVRPTDEADWITMARAARTMTMDQVADYLAAATAAGSPRSSICATSSTACSTAWRAAGRLRGARRRASTARSGPTSTSLISAPMYDAWSERKARRNGLRSRSSLRARS